MTEIYHNAAPFFTQWVVSGGYLHEPFVVIDIGVQGGPHPRWKHLGKCVHIYGFDPISEVIESLDNGKGLNEFYRTIALGNEDGERRFVVTPNTYESSFDKFDADPATQGDIALGTRMVQIRRLDTLFAAGEIPPADHIKIDCEGFEPEVIRGARNYLARSNVLCASVETNFGVSPVYLSTPFVEICEMLSEHRLLVFDLCTVRTARPSYIAARRRRPWREPDIMQDWPPLDVGQVGTFDFVFCRDFVAEANSPSHFVTLPGAQLAPTADKLIKVMMSFELVGLMDCAVDVAQYYRTQLSERIDVDEAIEHLIYRPAHTRYSVEVAECLRMIGNLRAHVGALAAEHVRTIQAGQECRNRVAQLEISLDTTKVLAARLGRRLATAPARLYRRYLA
jgi:FkbM family methyltransferase